MRTKDLLALEPGTPIAVCWGGNLKQWGGVPPEASKFILKEVRPNGRYTRVIAGSPSWIENEWSLLPRQIWGPYDEWVAAARARGWFVS